MRTLGVCPPDDEGNSEGDDTSAVPGNAATAVEAWPPGTRGRRNRAKPIKKESRGGG